MDKVTEHLLLMMFEEYYDRCENKYILSNEQMLRFLRFFVEADLEQERMVAEGNTRSIMEFLKDEFEMYDTLDNEYDKFNDHFNHMNVENQLVSGKGWKSRDIYEFQTEEAKILEESYHDLTYKRMRSNRISKIKFHEYRQFVEVLKENIFEDKVENQSLRLYKLEKRFNLELIKHILKVKREINQMVIKDLILTMGIPDIEGRHEYVKRYKRIIERSLMPWRMEVTSLPVFFANVIAVFKGLLNRRGNIARKSTDETRNIYVEERYVNNFEVDEDFQESDFAELMKELETINRDVLEKFKRKRGRPKKEKN